MNQVLSNIHLEKLAEIKNNTAENMDKITTDNFNNFFHLNEN